MKVWARPKARFAAVTQAVPPTIAARPSQSVPFTSCIVNVTLMNAAMSEKEPIFINASQPLPTKFLAPSFLQMSIP